MGNFGDGRINAFDPDTGAFLGALSGTERTPLQIEGLWGLLFGNGQSGGDVGSLYFTAGISGGGALEDHGLFGRMTAPPPAAPFANLNDHQLQLSWAGAPGSYLIQSKTNLIDADGTDLTTTTNLKTTVGLESGARFFRVLKPCSVTVRLVAP